MAPFLIMQLRPEDITADSEFEAILEHGFLDLGGTRRLRVERDGIPELNLAEYSGIIVGGSPFDVSKPQIEKSNQQLMVEECFRCLFDQIVPVDFPFLGACSGNGLLGSYCGAIMSTRYNEPVGGIDVTMTEDGRKDPLLAGFPSTFRVLVGHKEACDDVPPGAKLLLQGDICPVQMFRVKDNLYATQFHPEGDSKGFTTRIETYKDHGYFAPGQADALIAAVEQEDTPWGHRVLSRFVERYRS